MALTPISLKIIESTRVAPPPGTTPDRASLPFTYFDVFWINSAPVETLFFYRYPHSTNRFLSSLLPSLKSSFSLALKTYYPLTGVFHRIPGTENKFELYYVEGDAVPFTVAECNSQFENLANDHNRGVSQLNCLVPQLPKSEEVQPLLAVQMTFFPDKGVVIGLSMHHTACDGTSSIQFMQTWAETCSSGALVSSRLPIFDRTLISDPSDLYSSFYNQVQNVLCLKREAQEMQKSAPKDEKLASKPSELMSATFRFGQEQIRSLKKLISTKAKERKTSFHCSTIVVTVAYVWTCYIRAKRIDGTKKACLALPADCTARLQPPLPIEYFGNCLRSCMAKANVIDLIQEDGVITAAEVLGKAIDQVSEVLKTNKTVLDEYISGIPILGIAGSPRFNVYDVDFGIGRPAKVEILSALKSGSVVVAQSRDAPGGVEIGMAFSKDEMDCFKNYIVTGLKVL